MGEKMTAERAAFEKWADENKFGPKFRESMFAAWEARAHLTQPAQAVDVGAIREVIFWLTSNSHWISGAYEQGRKLTAALPKDSNGAEGV